MNQTPVDNYPRVRICGTLTTTSPLHCGSGEELPGKAWEYNQAQAENPPQGHINTLIKGDQERPIIPASTLRGSLRDRCRQPQALFGTASGETGRAGKLRIYDATRSEVPDDAGDLMRHPRFGTSLRHGVALDPITATAADRKLYTHEIVPSGSRFELVIEADALDPQQLQSLRQLLSGWNGDLASALGKGRGHGWGRVTWQEQQIEVITSQALASWATQAPSKPLPWSKLPCEPLPEAPPCAAFGFQLTAQGPILINDSGRVRRNPSDDNPAPDLEYLRDPQGRAVIPGSSLRGAVRGHARRILATIAHQHAHCPPQQATQIAEELIRELFGEEGRRGILWFGDAIASETTPVQQTMNAVDRFTGGVAKTALYSANRVEEPRFMGECYLDAPRASAAGWWKGLMLFVLRDLMEGELTLGWGKGKGYGAVELAWLKDGTPNHQLEPLLELLPDHPRWINALHDRITQQIKTQSTTA
jgi:CRISPR/Cas system CSM-associated protein Csm3 (group 7 of RAMP superfamily)